MASSERPPQTYFELFSRFAYSPNSNENAKLANDPEGFASVSDEVKERVDHPRLPFNWPAGDIPQANFFALTSMAEDALRQNGYTVEAAQLHKIVRMLTIPYEKIADALHPFLDFEPPAPLSAEALADYQALAQKHGLPLTPPAAARAHASPNPLAHRCSKLSEEWAWLVEHRDTVSIYGKDAVFEMSPQASVALARRWMRQWLDGSLDQEDPTRSDLLANHAWFSRQFPQGWARLDVFHETALVARSFDFEDRMLMLVWSSIEAARHGEALSDFQRIAHAHMSTEGLTGDALIAMSALDYFEHHTLPAFSSKAAADRSDPLVDHILRSTPSLGGLPKPVLIWQAYRSLFPEASSTIEKSFFTQATSKSDAALRSRLEALSLSCSIGSALIPSDGQPLSAAPSETLPSRGAPRL